MSEHLGDKVQEQATEIVLLKEEVRRLREALAEFFHGGSLHAARQALKQETKEAKEGGEG